MKKCNSCKKKKELTEFRKDKRIKDGHQGRCKVCVSAKVKLAYHSKYKEKANAYGKAVRIKNKENMNEYLSGKQCVHCGNNNPVVFEFHHVDPSKKEFAISNAKSGSWKTIVKELKKCIILCANCHRIEHRKV